MNGSLILFCRRLSLWSLLFVCYALLSSSSFAQYTGVYGVNNSGSSIKLKLVNANGNILGGGVHVVTAGARQNLAFVAPGTQIYCWLVDYNTEAQISQCSGSPAVTGTGSNPPDIDMTSSGYGPPPPPPPWKLHDETTNNSEYDQDYYLFINGVQVGSPQRVAPGQKFVSNLSVDTKPNDVTYKRVPINSDGTPNMDNAVWSASVGPNDSHWSQDPANVPTLSNTDNGNPTPPVNTGSGNDFGSGGSDLAKEQTLQRVGSTLHSDIQQGLNGVQTETRKIGAYVDGMKLAMSSGFTTLGGYETDIRNNGSIANGKLDTIAGALSTLNGSINGGAGAAKDSTLVNIGSKLDGLDVKLGNVANNANLTSVGQKIDLLHSDLGFIAKDSNLTAVGGKVDQLHVDLSTVVAKDSTVAGLNSKVDAVKNSVDLFATANASSHTQLRQKIDDTTAILTNQMGANMRAITNAIDSLKDKRTEADLQAAHDAAPGQANSVAGTGLTGAASALAAGDFSVPGSGGLSSMSVPIGGTYIDMDPRHWDYFSDCMSWIYNLVLWISTLTTVSLIVKMVFDAVIASGSWVRGLTMNPAGWLATILQFAGSLALQALGGVLVFWLSWWAANSGLRTILLTNPLTSSCPLVVSAIQILSSVLPLPVIFGNAMLLITFRLLLIKTSFISQVQLRSVG